MAPPDFDQDPVRITRRFGLDAGHRLAEHDFKCQNLHGHRYKFEITIEGYPDPDLGYLIDFSNVKGPVMDAFDHTTILNEDDPLLSGNAIWVIESEQEKEMYLMPAEPTAENIALETIDIIWDSMSDAERRNVTELSVRLWETPNCDVERRAGSATGDEEYSIAHP